ncbi:MAG: DUF4298 domain-containing protein [Bacteroidaceae bacterium]|nr:DUF4298 domain-containing protein [Bacteroidaceae bacterium]MBQ3958608.1 DUF4298 domain-containing protein [Bacteroidaceae bacterium]
MKKERPAVENSETVARVAAMERRYERAKRAVERMKRALDGFEAAQEDFALLSDYYDGPLWRHDFEADEAGTLSDMKRGVLSEDGLWDVLCERSELLERLGRGSAEN